MKRRNHTHLLTSQEAAERLKVPELALGQLAMDAKLTIQENFKFCEKQISRLENSDLSRYR